MSSVSDFSKTCHIVIDSTIFQNGFTKKVLVGRDSTEWQRGVVFRQDHLLVLCAQVKSGKQRTVLGIVPKEEAMHLAGWLHKEVSVF